jgi:hypothetical protein
MARRGRKRQTGIREPAGRLARAAGDPATDYAPAAIKRLTECAIRGVADAAFATPLGRLFLDGQLTATQYAAGRRFDRLIRNHTRALAAPPEPKSRGYDYDPRGPQIDPDSAAGQREVAEHRAIVAAMDEAKAVLASCGKTTEKIVRGLCADGELPAGAAGRVTLSAGLDALADHWGLTRLGRKRRGL